MPKYTREEILTAVQEAGGAEGKAPGRERFEAASGIRESHWRGIYWLSWSELVAEAGYTPNTMQGQRFTDAEILTYLAQFTRRLGRLPTFAELRMERTANADVPSDKSVARLGRQPDILAALRTHIERTPDLADVAEMLPGSTVDHAVTNEPKSMGHVYLIRMGKFHKIGRTNDLGRRTYELRTQMPERAEVIHSLETDDPEGIERYWHMRFADKRANGEWFQLSRADVAAFKRRGKFM
ncbi:MAG: GIY-YIG nuclease family protein [Gordonia sp. (in: high G+C Gram-positive bacteria)]